MEGLENQLNSVLGNPEMMQKIMAMAQSLQEQNSPSEAPAPVAAPPILGDIDLSMVQKLSAIVGKSNVDANQRNLLKALAPYLNQERIAKLEKAMRAAKLANMASSFLGSSGFSL